MLRGQQMADRPTGTVTFLFTDIEGSTRLLEQLRDRYDEVLSTHARLLRSAFDEFDGHEIDTQGDSFFAAFPRARDAVAAAVAAQRALAAEAWPDDVVVRVRMGIHTGEPLVGDERYVGMGVHRGARIMAAGHGGQVLLSNATRELAEDELPDDVRLADLGEHELKDLKRPERIFQLDIDGLPSSFPPLRTAQVSAFEGREGELERKAERFTWQRLRTRRIALGAAVTAAIVAVGLVIPLVLLGGSSEASVPPNSAVALDESGSIKATVPVGARPVALTSGAGALWVANLDDKSVTRIDLKSQQAVRAIPTGAAPTGITSTTDAVWITNSEGGVSKIDPAYDHLTETATRDESFLLFTGAYVRPMLAAFGSIWVASPDGFVSRISPVSGRSTGSVSSGNEPSAIAAGAGSVWVTNRSDGTVTRIDPTTLVSETIPVGHSPAAIAVNDAGAWVANAGDNTLVHIDPGTNAVVGTTPTGDRPSAVLAAASALWVANAGDGTVMRLDPRSGTVTKSIRVGGTPNALAAAGDHVWVSVAPAPPRPPSAGGVARLIASYDFSSLDPALGEGGGWLLFATCANLVTYPDEPAPEGSRVVPEVAEAVPVPTASGTTYTFKIRPGFHFSPPSGEAITAMTFKSTIERIANPRLKSPLADQFSGIEGYERYVTGKARRLSGVVARGSTLTIRLSKPDGGFLDELAGGAACAVPRGTPADAINKIPSAGPYYIASYTPREQLVLRRNPNYEGDRPHHLDQIVVTIGVDPARALEQVEAGVADYAFDLPREAAPRLESAYGAASNAAKAGHQQYFISPALGWRSLSMNTSRPLFSQLRLRRAVNYAIDRQALVAQGRRFAEVNPFNAGTPTDDYIPSSTTGARDSELYPVDGPDLRRAKRIAGHVDATAIMYTPNLSPWREEAQIIRRNLKPLGIDVQVKEFPIGEYFTRVGRRGEPFDLAVSGWSLPSPDPATALEIFDGNTIGPKGNFNFSYFSDPAFDRKVKAAAKLSGAERYRVFNQLALDLKRDAVPAAAIATTASRDFFSARMGCQVYQPVHGMDIAALCVRPEAPRG
jgi:YVTN family beta-propeller protein